MASIINAATSGGLITTADTSGILQLQTAGTTAVTVDASQRAAFVAGTAALPAITTTGDENTGIFFPAADTIAFAEGGAEAMRITSAGNVGVGTTSPSDFGAGFRMLAVSGSSTGILQTINSTDSVTTEMESESSRGAIGTRTNHPLVFKTNQTERARLNTTGAFVLAGGTTTANGIGITFPATQSASTNANTLDDYEEGTWTPVYSFSVSGAAAVVSNGIYIKIGSSVWVQGYLYISSSTACTGDATITGLPFTSNTTSRTNQGFSIGVARRFNVDMPNLRIALVNNTTVLNLFKQATNSNGETTLTNTDFNVQAEFNILYFQGTYSV